MSVYVLRYRLGKGKAIQQLVTPADCMDEALRALQDSLLRGGYEGCYTLTSFRKTLPRMLSGEERTKLSQHLRELSSC
jgi:hypothetical protein